MILKSLEINNIASIVEAKIDFTAKPLKDADLFLITGTTGAGKTTILDAICLALFATTPRLQTAPRKTLTFGQDSLLATDPRNLMRRGTGEAGVVLLFEGQDGHSYEARWHVQRGERKNVSAKLSNFTWSVVDLDNQVRREASNGNQYADVGNVIRAAIGLEFSEFCRTTMLAQGEFTRFLSSSADEKSAILEKITDTSIYTAIGQQIFRIVAEKRKAYSDEKDRLDAIVLLTAEERETHERLRSSLKERMNRIPTEQEALRERIAWVITEAADKKAVEEAKDNLRKAQSALASPEAVQMTEQVNHWLATVSLRQKLSELNRLRAERGGCAKQLVGLTPVYIKAAAGADWLYRHLTEKWGEYRRLRPEYIRLRKEIAALQAELEQIDLTGLLAEQKLLSERKNSREKLDTLNKEISRLTSSTVERQMLLRDKQIQLDREKQQLERLRIEKEQWAKTLDKFAVQMRVFLHSHLGSDDCVCPVCRQKVSSLCEDSELSSEAALLEKKFAEQSRLLNDEESGLEVGFRSLSATQAVELKQLADSSDTLSRLFSAEEQQMLLTLNIADVDLRIAEISRLFLRAGQLRTAIEKKTNELPDLDLLRTSFHTGLITYKSVCAIRRKVEAACPKWIGQALSPEEDRFLTDSWLQLAGVEQLRKQIEDADEAIRHLEREFSSDLSLTSFSEAYLHQLSGISQEDFSAMQNTVKAREKALDDADTTLRNALALQATHQKPASARPDDTESSLRLLIEALDKEQTEVTRRHTLTEKTLENDDAERLRKADTDSLLRLKTESERWTAFGLYFTDRNGDGRFLRNKVQCYVLSGLLRAANKHLHEMEPRYELERIGDSLELQLVDKQLADSTRGTISISGGESFLVSLSLALALADFGGNIGVNTLFIDEGFGTLSGTKLQASINMLQQVHSRSGRKVGIISHREEVKESIPVQIVVDKPEGSSEGKVSVCRVGI